MNRHTHIAASGLDPIKSPEVNLPEKDSENDMAANQSVHMMLEALGLGVLAHLHEAVELGKEVMTPNQSHAQVNDGPVIKTLRPQDVGNVARMSSLRLDIRDDFDIAREKSKKKSPPKFKVNSESIYAYANKRNEKRAAATI